MTTEGFKPSDDKMTEAQARQYIQQAERQPIEEVDEERLQEAIDVLDAGALGSGDFRYVRRATDLLVKKADRTTTIREARTSSAPPVTGSIPGAPEAARRTPESSAQAEQVAAASARLPSDLLNRLDQAAQRAGVPVSQIPSIIQEAQATVARESGGLTADMRAQLQASGLSPEQVAEYEASLVDPNAPTVEELLEGQIADWTTGAIGVPEGFVAVRDEEIDPNSSGLEMRRAAQGTPNPTRPQEVLPRYYTGDEWQKAGRPPEEIVQMQRQLERAGLLVPGEYYSGVWDQSTANALQSVMGMANASGQTWEEQLARLVANVPDSMKEQQNAAKLARQFQAPAFIKPDYATLAQDVKSTMRQRLGREPTDEEMGELTGAMSSTYRAQYEAEVAAMRAEFNAQTAGLETGVAQTPGAVQGVDPVARFLEGFDKRFAPEMDFIEGQEDTVINTDNVFASLTRLGNMG